MWNPMNTRKRSFLHGFGVFITCIIRSRSGASAGVALSETTPHAFIDMNVIRVARPKIALVTTALARMQS